MVNLHPLRPRHVPGLLTGQSQSGFLADAEHFPDDINRLNAGCVSVLIEEGVTRHLNRVGEPDVPVRVMLFGYPTFEKVITVTDTATAVEMRVCEVFRAAQPRQ